MRNSFIRRMRNNETGLEVLRSVTVPKPIVGRNLVSVTGFHKYKIGEIVREPSQDPSEPTHVGLDHFIPFLYVLGSPVSRRLRPPLPSSALERDFSATEVSQGPSVVRPLPTRRFLILSSFSPLHTAVWVTGQ